MLKRLKWVVFFLLVVSFSLTAQRFKRFEKDLSTNSWKIVLDESAQWQNDSLYLPPVNISTLPVNIPTGGWEMLE
ncbi:MAG: hypothetical protein N3A63_10265, partial [Bacteroidetes bacterium]|nr:hypothetical protein [Bacteroidota bacterium]